MIKVFGVSNHSPEAVIRMLVKCKQAAVQDIGILPVRYTLTPKKPTKHKFLFFLTPSDLLHNLEALRSPKYSECQSVVFDNPMKLAEIHGIQPLDFETNPDFPGFGFTLKTLDVSKIRSFKGSSSIDRRPGKYLSKLVNHVQQGSLLNPLMTLIYTVPSVMQNAVKAAAVKWLYFGKAEPYLDKYFDEIECGTLTKRIRQKFKDVLFTEVGQNFQQAFKLHRAANGKDLSVSKIAKQNSVSDYEMRYILSVIGGLKETYTDSFDKAKNRRKTNGRG